MQSHSVEVTLRQSREIMITSFYYVTTIIFLTIMVAMKWVLIT